MKNKYHFTISFNDLSSEKKMEIKKAIEDNMSVNDLPPEEQIDDVDYVENRISTLVDEACQVAWTELEVTVNGN